jgi:hypothetical protein
MANPEKALEVEVAQAAEAGPPAAAQAEEEGALAAGEAGPPPRSR